MHLHAIIYYSLHLGLGRGWEIKGIIPPYQCQRMRILSPYQCQTMRIIPPYQADYDYTTIPSLLL